MKHVPIVLLAAVILFGVGSGAAAADEAKPCTKIDEPCRELTFKGSPVLSREVFTVPPFYSEKIIKTTEGVTKITTFLTFIRVETAIAKSKK